VKSQGKTSQWKISEDDDDASDSEKMVICEDEATGNERHCWRLLLRAVSAFDCSIIDYVEPATDTETTLDD